MAMQKWGILCITLLRVVKPEMEFGINGNFFVTDRLAELPENLSELF